MNDRTYNASIKKLEIQLVQPPSNDNENRAVCSATVEFDDGRRFTELGESVGGGVEAASANARTRVMAHVPAVDHLPQQYSGNKPSSQSGSSLSKPNFAKANGGGTKPASHKQKDLIVDMCSKRGKNPDAIASEQFGKPLDDLQGAEANTIIQMLNGN